MSERGLEAPSQGSGGRLLRVRAFFIGWCLPYSWFVRAAAWEPPRPSLNSCDYLLATGTDHRRPCAVSRPLFRADPAGSEPERPPPRSRLVRIMHAEVPLCAVRPGVRYGHHIWRSGARRTSFRGHGNGLGPCGPDHCSDWPLGRRIQATPSCLGREKKRPRARLFWCRGLFPRHRVRHRGRRTPRTAPRVDR